MKKQIPAILYFTAAAGNLLAQLIASPTLNENTKPLLMPLLIFLIFQEAGGLITLPRLLLAVALVFSWIGDVLLMFQAQHELFFLGGLGAFLLAQWTYLIIFRKVSFQPLRWDWKRLWPIVALAAILLPVLLWHAGSLILPVGIYGVSLLSVVAFAHLREGHTEKQSYQYALAGTVLFLASDTLIALGKFVVEIPLGGFWVMLTYIAAQYLIVKGVLRHPA